MATAGMTWSAIGTSVTVLVTDSRTLDPAAAAVDRVVREADAAYSRFRDDSELSRVNARPGRPHRISPLLTEAVGAALRAARLTGGAVDPTVGRAMRLCGYDRDFAEVAAAGAPLRLVAQPVPGWTAVRLDTTARRLTVPVGVELDLGSVGKALASDMAAAAALEAARSGGVLVSLGGDIAVAGTAPEGGWRVLVAEDSAAPLDGPGPVVRVTSGAVATSSTTVRRWTRGGAVLHHIVDPATGLPARGVWRTVTVAAATCVDANAAATAAIVDGETAVERLSAAALPARLVAVDGSVVTVAGWPADEAVPA